MSSKFKPYETPIYPEAAHSSRPHSHLRIRLIYNHSQSEKLFYVIVAQSAKTNHQKETKTATPAFMGNRDGCFPNIGRHSTGRKNQCLFQIAVTCSKTLAVTENAHGVISRRERCVHIPIYRRTYLLVGIFHLRRAVAFRVVPSALNEPPPVSCCPSGVFMIM